MASSQNRTQTRVDTWHDVGHTSNLSLSWDKRGIREKRAHILLVHARKRGEEGKKRAKLPSKIYGVPWVGFHRAKNKSSPHQQEVRVGT